MAVQDVREPVGSQPAYDRRADEPGVAGDVDRRVEVDPNWQSGGTHLATLRGDTVERMADDTRQLIRYDVDGKVGIVTIDRPEKRNAMTYAMLDDFIETIGRADADRRGPWC